MATAITAEFFPFSVGDFRTIDETLPRDFEWTVDLRFQLKMTHFTFLSSFHIEWSDILRIIIIYYYLYFHS